MRFVDITGLDRPRGWDESAERARLAVADATDRDQRKAVIATHQTVWRNLKEALEKLSGKKCWYCESIEVRSDKHVDHFRPKSAVSEEGCADHPGYWWLAFDWRNYRYSCTYCNSRRTDVETGTVGGKAARFPLRNEAQRCYGPTDTITDEQPALLDPTKAADPGLLWYYDDGTAVPAHSSESAWWPAKRAEVSIELYHLNHTDLKEARQAVCIDCTQLVAKGDEAWPETANGAAVGGAIFEEVMRRLFNLLASTSEYSAAASATLRGLNTGDRPWLSSLLGPT